MCLRVEADGGAARVDQMTYQAMLSNEQYPWLEPLLPPPSNHLKIPHRQVLDAWLYVCYRGCA